ncbi:ATP-dependent DNA ligase [Microbacterium sp. YY-01]|uniref:ATP-dependent DNA ligase n=1 Tax=Microbacterium sp. YY-01 TaxID=3421634 RepID=UPI003D16C43A
MAKQEQSVRAGGRSIRVSNLDKVLYPQTGTTKADVIGYYSAIAPTMLPHCRDRAATRKRWPNGVGDEGQGSFFFQKDIGDSAPEWVSTAEIEHKDHVNTYPLVNDEATLVWLAQLAALEIHVPQWRFDDAGRPQHPDRLVFDLDPGEGVTLRDCAQVAFMVRDILADMGLTTVPVTSGSKGIHLYAALDGTQSSQQSSAVAHELARALEADHPDLVTSSMKRDVRGGRVFIDWSQNNAAKTTVAPYSLRGRATPTVATPRTWRELASPHVRHLEFHEVLDRVARRGDPLTELYHDKNAPDAADRLSTYRSKRRADRTPEPVPQPGARDDDAEDDPARAPIFVIQRHDARRLHWDFRLEHEGVLVSWALPKGVPTDTKVNHLAVPTEDHPMSYRHFEGSIPKGEYGGGEVRIWDSGTYKLEKWRDDEVIATLTGQPDGGLGGTRRFALFRAGEQNGKPRWMIHLMAEQQPAHGKQPQANAQMPDTTHSAPPRPRSVSAPFTPMLTVRAPLSRLHHLDADEWAFEMKWDGIRAIVSLDGERCTVRTRSGADVTDTYPELAAVPSVVAADQAVLDGEIVALDAGGAPSFSRLQHRFGVTDRAAIDGARQAAPVSFLAFDVLSINGRDCRALSYTQRRELLAQLIEPRRGVPVAVPDAAEGSATDAIETSRELRLEGVVAKRRASTYLSGERSAEWLKFPLINTDEVVIAGWRDSEADPRGFASLLLAQWVDGAWCYRGRVGTGFSADERRTLRTRLESLHPDAAHSTAPDAALHGVPADIRRDAHWVRLELIGEVTSKGLTDGGHFRQPVWRGLRPDKTLDDMVRGPNMVRGPKKLPKDAQLPKDA